MGNIVEIDIETHLVFLSVDFFSVYFLFASFFSSSSSSSS